MPERVKPSFGELRAAFNEKWGEAADGPNAVGPTHPRAASAAACPTAESLRNRALLIGGADPSSQQEQRWIEWATIVLWCLSTGRIAQPRGGRLHPVVTALGLCTLDDLLSAQQARAIQGLSAEVICALAGYRDPRLLQPPPESRLGTGGTFHDADYESLPPGNWTDYDPAELYGDPSWRPYPTRS